MFLDWKHKQSKKSSSWIYIIFDIFFIEIKNNMTHQMRMYYASYTGCKAEVPTTCMFGGGWHFSLEVLWLNKKCMQFQCVFIDCSIFVFLVGHPFFPSRGLEPVLWVLPSHSGRNQPQQQNDRWTEWVEFWDIWGRSCSTCINVFMFQKFTWIPRISHYVLMRKLWQH